MNPRPLSAHGTKYLLGVGTALVLFIVLHQAGLGNITGTETEGLNTLILLMGSIYAVMFAFVIFVIWGQFTEVEALAARECSALKDLQRFTEFVHPDSQRSIRRAISDYCRLVVNSEWALLARQQKDFDAERAFSKILRNVINAVPAGATEDLVHKRLVDMVRSAADCRDQRIEKSLTRIPPTLMRLVRGMALGLALLIFVYPFHHPTVGASCFVLISSVLFCADVVMMDTDNPFDGLCNVSARSFEDVTS